MVLKPPPNTRQILQSILKLMQDSKSSVNAKFQDLFQLLSAMPPWPQWTPQADSVVGSTLTGLHPELVHNDEKDPHSNEEFTSVLLTTLIELNGNTPMLTHDSLESCDERFSFVFLQWLHGAHAPHDNECHVQDEYGTWLTDRQLRAYLKEGAELHIPTRTVGESTSFNRHHESALSSPIKEEVS